MLLRHGIGRWNGGLCSKSHRSPRYGKVCGMNLPPVPRDERRTVPRHLRDSEHDPSGAAPGAGSRAEDGHDAGRRLRTWIYAGVLLLLGIGLWFGLTAD